MADSQQEIEEGMTHSSGDQDDQEGWITGFSSDKDYQKEDTVCSCGDDAHKNLEDWYEDYLSLPNYSCKLLPKDKINTVALEEKIQDMLSRTSLSNGYCPSCQRLLAQWAEVIKKVLEHELDEGSGKHTYWQPHFRNTVEFEAGYQRGCLLCRLLVQCSIENGNELEAWHRRENRLNCLGKSTSISIAIRTSKSGFGLQLSWPGIDPGFQVWWENPTAVVYCIQNHGRELFDLKKDATRLTGLSQLELAKKWVDTCLETHQSCKSTEYYQLPTRLIDLDSIPIRLVLSSELTTKVRYATLSHCWGSKDFYKLQQDNLDDLMRAIPVEKLTQTFQDAIRITCSLSIRYLWIDSLCIIQNCEKDWRIESVLMSTVYGNSTVTIAAAGATDGTMGCFLKPAGFIGKVHFKVTTDEVWDFAPPKFCAWVDQSPLASRAWALQERLLSPRVLHFSKTELFWECRQCKASETFPEFRRESVQDAYHPDRRPIPAAWNEVVNLYTTAKLTFPDDKLIAISGIAKKVFAKNEDQYLAGLWRKDIEFQILWYTSGSACEVLPPTGGKYRAPSWSWASTDRTVTYFPRCGRRYVYYAHCLSAEVVPAGESPFGKIKAAELRMSYSVMLAGRFNASNKVEIDSSNGAKESFTVDADYEVSKGQIIYLFPVLETSQKNEDWIEGLLLLPVGSKRGEYSRVGCFSISGREIDKWGLFQRMLKESGKTIAEERCAEILEEPEFENERYVITLI